MEKRQENPPAYKDRACCDICGLLDLPEQVGEFYHCPVCKFDKCPQCCAVAVRYHRRCTKLGGVTLPEFIEVPQDAGMVVRAKEAGSDILKAAGWSFKVWNAATALARYLEERPSKGPGTADCQNKRVLLELGAGSALVSLVLAGLGTYSNLIVTDRREALHMTCAAVRRNFPQVSADSAGKGDTELCAEAETFSLLPKSASSAEDGAAVDILVRPLDWLRPEEDLALLKAELSKNGLPPPSVVVAADVVFDKMLVKPLVETICHIRDSWIRAADMQPVPLFISRELRGVSVESAFTKGLRSRGIIMKRITSPVVRLEGHGRVEILRADL